METVTEQNDAAPAARSGATAAAQTRRSLLGLTRAELGDLMGEIGVPEKAVRMRVNQLWHWIYLRGATSFDVMTTIGKDLRAELSRHFSLARPEIVTEQISNDGTRKWLAATRCPLGT